MTPKLGLTMQEGTIIAWLVPKGTPSPRELAVEFTAPIVRGANRLGLIDREAETALLATAICARPLAAADFEGGTFAVPSMGIFCVDFFTPIINSPGTAAQFLGAVRDRLESPEQLLIHLGSGDRR